MEDSLVATRARRANAGSRLKQLIELEEQSNDLQLGVSQIITEDDENVNLLFQEDENDEEFEDEDVDNENLRGIDEEDEDEEDEGEEGEDGESEELSKKRKITEGPEGDDVLSDSDLSVSDSDESEGEKELEKQEKIKKKAQRKKLALIPAIKKVKIDNVLKKSKPKVIASDSLLLSVRRSSSRAAVVENKQALVEKLQANEKRRAQLTPIVRIKHKDLTQEEKLAEAVETEKANVLSLQEFQEQEVVKKEKQRQLLLLKRKRLTNVVRLVSREDYVGPDDEIREARRIYDFNKSKKRPGRRRKNQEEDTTRYPGSVDPEIPLMKQELERQRLEEKERELAEGSGDGPTESLTAEGNKQSGMGLVDGDTGSTTPNPGSNGSLENVNGVNASQLSPSIKSEGTEEKVEPVPINRSEAEARGNTSSAPSPNENDEKTTQDPEGSLNDIKIDTTPPVLEDLPSTQSNNVSTVNGINNETQQNAETPNSEEYAPRTVSKEGSSEIKIAESENSVVVKQEQDDNSVHSKVDFEDTKSNLKPDTTEKEVRFADDIKGSPSEQPDSKDHGIRTSNRTFEGPEQKVTRNMVYLFDFDVDKRLDTTGIKSYMFGPESLLPASRRFKDLKTILRIGKVINPYAVVKEEKDELFEPVSELTEDDAIFDDLKKLPRLGVAQEIIEDVKEDSDGESQNIVLKTEAPAGIYLPNGNRKSCLLAGTEVKYFDPNNGVPYSTVETYKLLKQIEQGQVPWLSLGPEKQGGYPIELYYGAREGMRHAKGVPEGFE
ncbi:YL1-domain-containing protein [Suhomyces tanzawaensis NRRL Y-17324]|uniref:YL1-domain-containing protein n=1 Tax=Suhomyces tanzawaensis NRRL Y-17324 TaxID=984487 RepID=A0A1E4SQT9_9ASCO|nr:YL1-domain-containing protein [Suhomyces tanzawaensis NRRL Y-17324]ODV81876.1 YL1-domain-containing protein [Suhomyces tanzawaensis NRRL Y-17324]